MSTHPLIDSPTLSEALDNSLSCKQLARALATFLESQRWFASKNEEIQTAEILDSVTIPNGDSEFELLIVSIITSQETADCYAVPMSTAQQSAVSSITSTITSLVGTTDANVAVIECSGDPEFWRALTTTLAEQSLTTRNGRELKLSRTSNSQLKDSTSLQDLPFAIHCGEQSNSAVAIGNESFMKLFRRPRAGQNPDAEVGRFLTDKTSFCHSPRVDATINIHGTDGDRCLALISEQVQGGNDAWTSTLGHLKNYWMRLDGLENRPELPPKIAADTTGSSSDPETDELTEKLMGPFPEDMALLGRRTAELHTALSSSNSDPAFSPEPVTSESLSDLIHQLRVEVQETCQLLERTDGTWKSENDLANRISERANSLLDGMTGFDPSLEQIVNIRCHGDYHLGQVLKTPSDFVILDFEGEPDRPFDERRLKRCALKDVAGMVRSLHYASCAASVGLLPAPPQSIANAGHWQSFWYNSAAGYFVAAYQKSAAGQPFLPTDQKSFDGLLDLFLIEKVLYELRYEINNRPDWIPIPLTGLTSVLKLDQ